MLSPHQFLLFVCGEASLFDKIVCINIIRKLTNVFVGVFVHNNVFIFSIVKVILKCKKSTLHQHIQQNISPCGLIQS
jgi:hypothetical protein